MLNKFSTWFDSLKEPSRFFTFILIVFGCYVPFMLAMLISDAFTGHEWLAAKIVLVVLGVCQVFFLIVLAIYRATRK